ncbi:DUF1792 domain-containing protein [bacterium 1XD42-94]|nr:DUF1792 domain-containing protein [bacterium 1XD42-76]NBK06930.1 DUF1792 domain-containing protein [bacterium 1XD42-94]
MFPLFKELWKGRSVIIVEGKYGRNGVNNDLFHTAREMKRVLCPPQNAWKSYDRIKESILKIAKKDDLICISLGFGLLCSGTSRRLYGEKICQRGSDSV